MVVPAHHNAEAYMDADLQVAGFERTDKASPLFRTFRGVRTGRLTENRMNRVEVFWMIWKRALKRRSQCEASCHTFRETGITAYLNPEALWKMLSQLLLMSPPGHPSFTIELEAKSHSMRWKRFRFETRITSS